MTDFEIVDIDKAFELLRDPHGDRSMMFQTEGPGFPVILGIEDALLSRFEDMCSKDEAGLPYSSVESGAILDKLDRVHGKRPINLVVGCIPLDASVEVHYLVPKTAPTIKDQATRARYVYDVARLRKVGSTQPLGLRSLVKGDVRIVKNPLYVPPSVTPADPRTGMRLSHGNPYPYIDRGELGTR